MRLLYCLHHISVIKLLIWKKNYLLLRKYESKIKTVTTYLLWTLGWPCGSVPQRLGLLPPRGREGAQRQTGKEAWVQRSVQHDSSWRRVELGLGSVILNYGSLWHCEQGHMPLFVTRDCGSRTGRSDGQPQQSSTWSQGSAGLLNILMQLRFQ